MSRAVPRWMWASALAVYLFLYLPLLVVVVFSFNDSKLNAEWVGFTTAWYAKLFRNSEMLTAARNSLLIALVAALVSTALGTMAGFALHKYRMRVLPVLVVAPIAIPEILMGVALLMFFVLLNVTLGLVSIALSHIAFCIGYVALVVRARLAGMDESLVEAARDCGATPRAAFRYITLPLILPFIFIAGMIRLIDALKSFDIIFAITQGGPGSASETINLYLYSVAFVYYDIGYGSAIAVVFFVLIIILAAVMLYFRQRFHWNEAGGGA